MTERPGYLSPARIPAATPSNIQSNACLSLGISVKTLMTLLRRQIAAVTIAVALTGLGSAWAAPPQARDVQAQSAPTNAIVRLSDQARQVSHIAEQSGDSNFLMVDKHCMD